MVEDSYINYPKIVDEGMHSAIRKILQIVASNGVKDPHQIFISFLTKFPGVSLSKRVKIKHPHEITIVLQHQFEELVVEEDYFSLFLSFNGILENVVVPYKAITTFSDSGAKFAMQFNYYVDNLPTLKQEEIGDIKIKPTKKEIEYQNASKEKVIVLDKFRPK